MNRALLFLILTNQSACSCHMKCTIVGGQVCRNGRCLATCNGRLVAGHCCRSRSFHGTCYQHFINNNLIRFGEKKRLNRKLCAPPPLSLRDVRVECSCSAYLLNTYFIPSKQSPWKEYRSGRAFMHEQMSCLQCASFPRRW